MRTNKAFWLGAALLSGLAVSTANAQIVNSDHNFSSMSWSGGEICKPCHTPHFANATAGALWNHALTTATYTLFGGSSGTAALDVDRVSRLCLSCHDGTVALDSFGGQTGTNFMPNDSNLTTDLSNDHPIGAKAVYPTTTSTSFNVPPLNGIRTYDWTDHNGVAQKVVGCKSCHDPHNKGGFPHMLRISNASSALCLSCHIK